MTDSSNKKLIPPGAEVTKFEMRNLRDADRPTYQSIKSTFRKDLNSPKNARFLLSDMVHDHLSVEAEEERRFNDKVNAELEKLSEEVSSKAFDEGFAKGSEEGRKQAYDSEKARLAAVYESLSYTIGLIEEGRIQMEKQYEVSLVDLAFKMASAVVDHQVRSNRELVAHSVKAILEKIGQEEDIRIWLSADDLEVVKTIEKEMKNVAHRGRIAFELDPSLSAGDCLVESSSGEIASIIDEKMSKLREELTKIYPELDVKSDDEDPSGMTGT
ncbi:hypothetical protein GW916_04150 [bacterium]|nr:hypothetical protein [bacterium]